jgi:hypothetical protein
MLFAIIFLSALHLARGKLVIEAFNLKKCAELGTKVSEVYKVRVLDRQYF